MHINGSLPGVLALYQSIYFVYIVLFTELSTPPDQTNVYQCLEILAGFTSY
jgi:hypothetical protein